MLSVINLYLQRKDRRPRLRIRARYEYRTAPPTASGHDAESLRVHDDSQGGLYLLLRDLPEGAWSELSSGHSNGAFRHL